MPYLVAAVVLFGALTILNLLLNVTVLKRLGDREHEHSPVDDVPFGHLDPGEAVPEFVAARTDGEPFTHASFTGETTALGFFSSSCLPCRDHLPAFLAYARKMPRGTVIAVITGDLDEAEDLLTLIAGEDVTVVHEPHGGPMAAAFKINSFPTFYLVGPEGTVAAANSTIRLLPAKVPA